MLNTLQKFYFFKAKTHFRLNKPEVLFRDMRLTEFCKWPEVIQLVKGRQPLPNVIQCMVHEEILYSILTPFSSTRQHE